MLRKSAVAAAVAQEVLRWSKGNLVQQRIAECDTVVAGIQVPKGMPVWMFATQVGSSFCNSIVWFAAFYYLIMQCALEHDHKGDPTSIVKFVLCFRVHDISFSLFWGNRCVLAYRERVQ